MPVRIGAVSPMDNAMDAISEAFEDIWPEAELFHVLDESLYLDFAGGKPQNEETGTRLSSLMHYAADTVQPNYVTRYSDGWRAPMAPILEAIRPSEPTATGHPRFTFVRQVLGYYYAVEVYRYDGPRGPMNVCIEGADLADIERDRRRRDDPVIHELVFHPDASLCSTWQPWDGRIL